jgi:hypothetical protein
MVGILVLMESNVKIMIALLIILSNEKHHVEMGRIAKTVTANSYIPIRVPRGVLSVQNAKNGIV